MSDNKDNLQDYLDLLDKASSEIERENNFKEATNEAPEANEISAEAFSDVSDIVNVSDYEDENYKEDTSNGDSEKQSAIPTVEDVLSNSPKKDNILTKIAEWYKGLPKKKQIIVKNLFFRR